MPIPRENVEDQSLSDPDASQPLKEQINQLVEKELRRKAHISRDELFHLLSKQGQIISESLDIDWMNRIEWAMDKETQTQRERLLNSNKWVKWIKTPVSQALLVNGSFNKESTISSCSALLMKALHSSGRSLVIGHFCGSHLEAEDDFAGPHGPLKNLTTQLLAQWDFGDLKCLDNEDVDLLRNQDKRQHITLISLICLFRTLINALPPRTPLFIVIDNISLYMTREHKDNACDVIERIHKLVGQHNTVGKLDDVYPMVKVLVTSRGWDPEMAGIFEPIETILILRDPSGSERSDSTGFGAEMRRS